jgi:threonine synthase
MQKFLAEEKKAFSSANSINFGRLVPQIIYYVSAYCDLVKDGKIKLGDKINVVVPTGNFGNILAAVYARNMGIPIAKFICASNRNKILTDFIPTGKYDRNREFYQTSSPSMDILISSNLERMLYHLYDNNAEVIASLMKDLKEKGVYEVSPAVLEKLQKEFFGGFCDDANCAATIKKLFDEYHYLCDTHTAVAVNVYEQYIKETNDTTPCVIASTASPYKFASAVLPALNGNAGDDEFAMLDKLSEVSGTPVPAPLANLHDKKVLHKKCVNKTEMSAFIKDFLK